MHETDARRLADKVTELLAAPGQLVADDMAETPPLTFPAILVFGFMFGKMMRVHYPESREGFPVSEEFMAAMLATPRDPGVLREFFYQAFLSSNEDFAESEMAMELVTKEKLLSGMRKDFLAAFDEIFPPGPPGRQRKITQGDFPKLYQRIERLRPVFVKLVRLQEQFPGKDLKELLQFLSSEHPTECAYIGNRLPALAKLCSESQALANAKTAKARARIMADLLAGNDYELGAVYALQKAQEARRFVRGKERKRKPRLPRVPELSALRDS